jgi:hypothetical protein
MVAILAQPCLCRIFDSKPYFELFTFLVFIEIKLKRSFIINGLLQYFGNTSCHYQAKMSKEKKIL